MKFSHFQQIIDRIRTDVPCPECGTFFDEAEIDIMRVSSKNIEFFIPCPHCGAEVVVLAQIEIIQRVHQTIETPLLQKEKTGISPKKVKDISSLLQSFRGRDIRELF
jgi:endogenous inhibitor of DNA gyrase (YacG/DUF329 family)